MNTNYPFAAVASSRDSRPPSDMLELKRDEQNGRFSRCVIMTQLPRMLQKKINRSTHLGRLLRDCLSPGIMQTRLMRSDAVSESFFHLLQKRSVKSLTHIKKIIKIHKSPYFECRSIYENILSNILIIQFPIIQEIIMIHIFSRFYL